MLQWVKNKVRQELNELRDALFVTDDVAQRRLRTCESCPKLRVLSRQCRICNCFVDVKTKLKKIPDPVGDGIVKCPQNLWS